MGGGSLLNGDGVQFGQTRDLTLDPRLVGELLIWGSPPQPDSVVETDECGHGVAGARAALGPLNGMSCSRDPW